MTKIKLKEWADKHGLSYLTANRHFHAGMIPGATQLDSGTILVEDDSLEQNMAPSSTDAMSLFIKKTVEFSKNNATIEDFAAFIVATFQLKLQGSESPRYSKNRPKSEDVQKHFQQFLPDQKEVEHLKAVKTLIKEGKNAGDVMPSNLSPQAVELQAVLGNATPFERVNPISEYPVDDFSVLLADAAQDNLQAPPIVEGLVSRSVDFNTTPQQINYTGSTSQPFSFGGQVTVNAGMGLGVDSSTGKTGANYVSTNSVAPNAAYLASNFVASTCDASLGFTDGAQGVFLNAAGPATAATPSFHPTQKELESANKVIETADADVTPRKRGRKPTFKKG